LDNVLLVDQRGKVIAAGVPGKIVGADLNDRDYYSWGCRAKRHFKPVISVDKGQPVFVVASPVRLEGKVVGVIVAGVNIGYFSEKFVVPMSGAEGEMFVLSPDGLVIAHPDKALQAKANLVNETGYGRRLFGQNSGQFETGDSGVGKIVLFEKSPMTAGRRQDDHPRGRLFQGPGHRLHHHRHFGRRAARAFGGHLDDPARQRPAAGVRAYRLGGRHCRRRSRRGPGRHPQG
jgi:hypothetical protein